MRRSKLGFTAVSLAFAATLASSSVVLGADVLMDGQTVMVTKDSHFRADSVRFNSGGGNGFPVPSDDPRDVGGTLTVFDTGGGAGSDTYQLPAGGWKKIPPGNPGKVNGFEYTGSGVGDDPCKYVIVRPQLVKAFCKGNVILSPPFTGDVAIVLEIGGTRYCAQFGGSNVKNNGNKTTRVGAESPAACPGGGGGTTSTWTPTVSTTSTSAP
jgi:hypothetical protein